MNHIFYQTKTQFTNSGDAFINREFIGLLRNYGTVYAYCGKDIPRAFISELELKAGEKCICRSQFSFVMKMIKCRLSGIMNGDKVFVFSGLGDIHGGRIKKAVNSIIGSFAVMLFGLIGIKSIRIGRSYGELSRYMKIAERIRGNIVNRCYVRDMASLKYCRSIGISNVRYCPDFSWLLKHKKESINNTDFVLLVLKRSTYGYDRPDYEKALLDSCKRIIDIIIAENKNTVLLFGYQVSGDKTFTLKAYDHFRKYYRAEIIDHRLGLKEMDEIYSKCGYHISNRMHSLLYGFKMGSFPIAPIDTKEHRKITAALEDCRLNNIIVDVYNNDSSEISEMIRRRHEIFGRLIRAENKNRAGIIKVTNDIFKE